MCTAQASQRKAILSEALRNPQSSPKRSHTIRLYKAQLPNALYLQGGSGSTGGSTATLRGLQHSITGQPASKGGIILMLMTVQQRGQRVDRGPDLRRRHRRRLPRPEAVAVGAAGRAPQRRQRVGRHCQRRRVAGVAVEGAGGIEELHHARIGLPACGEAPMGATCRRQVQIWNNKQLKQQPAETTKSSKRGTADLRWRARQPLLALGTEASCPTRGWNILLCTHRNQAAAQQPAVRRKPEKTALVVAVITQRKSKKRWDLHVCEGTKTAS